MLGCGEEQTCPRAFNQTDTNSGSSLDPGGGLTLSRGVLHTVAQTDPASYQSGRGAPDSLFPRAQVD